MTADERARRILIDVATVLAGSDSEDVAGAEAVIARGLRAAEQAMKERCARICDEAERRNLSCRYDRASGQWEETHSSPEHLAAAIRKLE